MEFAIIEKLLELKDQATSQSEKDFYGELYMLALSRYRSFMKIESLINDYVEKNSALQAKLDALRADILDQRVKLEGFGK